MQDYRFTNAESYFLKENIHPTTSKVPYIAVNNFPQLGLLTALRFLEWVSENPNGIISLPTGKTPEYFIRWTQFIMDNWDNKKGIKFREQYGLKTNNKPTFDGLHFVQIDEFYPINSFQKNSFYYYVNEYYIKGFGLNPNNALLINSNQIPLFNQKDFTQIFPNNVVDLSLRYREAKSIFEYEQQRSIFMIDDWCVSYEEKIQAKGGIGFFLGGIGPDGHIAFNTRGSDHNSTTRLTKTNFETQAQAAGDLGGIEISRNRLVITIGLKSITYNSDAVAIIFAAGEAKADVVKNALEAEPSVLYPATALHKLKNSRFYITQGAGIKLRDSIKTYFFTGEWTAEKTERAIIDLCKRINKFGPKLTLQDLKEDPFCSKIPDVTLNTVQKAIKSIKLKINLGLKTEQNQRFYHTGPHHDDIQLGMQPLVNRTLKEKSNHSVFSIMTSGFTAVTNQFIINALESTIELLDSGKIQMTEFPNFFDSGYQLKWDKDVYHYLLNVASNEENERLRGLCHRMVRAITHIWNIKDVTELKNTISSVLKELYNSYDGQKNAINIQRLKGMVREFEEELVWAHSGVQVKNVHHLRLGFYTGDIFTETPKRDRDVLPILKELKELNPTVISLALDPEGSGPDTHYKVLQAIAEAIRFWKKEKNLSQLRIWGYRNVWYRFAPSEINKIVPVSINSLSVLNQSFSDCYLSQVNASFPSHEYDGKFSELTQKIWVEQLESVQYLLGKDFFYTHDDPRIRATHGLIFVKEMGVEEFLLTARKLEKSMEGPY